MNNNEITSKHVFAFLWSNIKQFPFHFFVVFAQVFGETTEKMVLPYIGKLIIDRLETGNQKDVFSYLFALISIYVLISLFISFGFRLYEYFVQAGMIPLMRKNIGIKCMELLLEKDHAFFQGNFSGSISNKINNLTEDIPEIFSIFRSILVKIMLVCFAILILWKTGTVFGLAMLVWATTFTVVALLLTKYLTKLADMFSEQQTIISGKFVDTLSNILAVRLFTAKRYEIANLNKSFDTQVFAEKKLNKTYYYLWWFYDMTFLTLLIFNFYFLLTGRQKGTISIGDFALVITINFQILGYLWLVGREFSDLSKHFGSATQALRTILEEPKIVNNPNAFDLKVSNGEILFEKVKFNYDGLEPLFENKSIKIESGQKVGLVGYSGSGKTTFVNLILRLYDLASGRILIDGQSINMATQESLRAAISVIPQDSILFNRTIIENIRYGLESATDQEVIQAAKAARAHDFIVKLADGYNTLAGERGIKLSGGQRQRISIARAFLKNAPILILDEATSQLDSVTEHEIQESLCQLMNESPSSNTPKKTVIAIAHRLSTLLNMDRILVFNSGKIVQDGSHQELLAKDGLYKNLWAAQTNDFLDDDKI